MKKKNLEALSFSLIPEMWRKTIESTQRIRTDQKKGEGGSKIDFGSFSLFNKEVSSK